MSLRTTQSTFVLLDFLAPSPLGALAHAHAQQNLPIIIRKKRIIILLQYFASTSIDYEGLHGSSIRQVRASFCSTCFFEVVAIIDGV